MVALFSLKPHGEEINLPSIVDITSFNFVITKSTNYGTFVKNYCHKKDEVS